MFESVVDKLRGAKKIVFVTGAGISQESGIPTFRGKDGLWRKYDAMKLATIDAFYEDPKVVWFGEPLPQDVWQDAMLEASSCDVMVVAGTSLVVSPANLLPVYAKQNGAIMIEVNPEETPMSGTMDLSLRSSAAKALPELVSIVS